MSPSLDDSVTKQKLSHSQNCEKTLKLFTALDDQGNAAAFPPF